jgi:hypothetical protein
MNIERCTHEKKYYKAYNLRVIGVVYSQNVQLQFNIQQQFLGNKMCLLNMYLTNVLIT